MATKSSEESSTCGAPSRPAHAGALAARSGPACGAHDAKAKYKAWSPSREMRLKLVVTVLLSSCRREMKMAKASPRASWPTTMSRPQSSAII